MPGAVAQPAQRRALELVCSCGSNPDDHRHRVRMRRLLLGSLAAAVLLVLAGAAAPENASATPGESAGAAQQSFLIWITPTSKRLGEFRIGLDPSYQGAIDVFGDASQCRLVNGGWMGIPVWYSAGFRMNVVSYGYVGSGTPCSEPAEHWIDRITVTGRRWRTRSGLRVGASVATLRKLYPQAQRHRGFAPGFWLVAQRQRCVIGDCESKYETVPHLVAKVRRGRVSAFVIHVGAQGE